MKGCKAEAGRWQRLHRARLQGFLGVKLAGPAIDQGFPLLLFSPLIILMAPDVEKKKSIVFLHPDLGIGGAERLVIDAAVGLQNRGHKVVIFTSHCDPKHCFDEARDGMNLLSNHLYHLMLGQVLSTYEFAVTG